MIHDLNVEERLFTADIEALIAYDRGFSEAWKNNTEYRLEIKLPDIFEVCPRKYARTFMYSRLINFLATKNITLKVISRKQNNKKHETDS